VAGVFRIGPIQAGGIAKPRKVCRPVVVTVRVVVPLPATETGFTEHLASRMSKGTWQLKVAVPENVPTGVSAIVAVPDWPAEMVMLAVLGTKLKSEMVIVTGAEVELE